MPDIWKPAVTVASIIERDGLFLMIEEDTSDGRRINQPAGHLDPGESLLHAVIRESREEAAIEFKPTFFIGSYLACYMSIRRGFPVTYLRFAFTGELIRELNTPLDTGIVRTLWMSYAELVLRCVDDYLAGQRLPLSAIYTDSSVAGEIK